MNPIVYAQGLSENIGNKSIIVVYNMWVFSKSNHVLCIIV